MTGLKHVAITKEQAKKMLGVITHETLHEGTKHRNYICGNPVRRGVEGWPLLGRGASLVTKGFFMLGGEKGRKALAHREEMKKRELKEVQPGCEEDVKSWNGCKTPHFKRNTIVSLPDIWGGVSAASAKLQNGQSGNADFSMASDGRPSDVAYALGDLRLPEGVAIGPGQTEVLAQELKDLDALRKMRFIANPAQIECLEGKFNRAWPFKPKATAMEAAFACSETLKDRAYAFFANQLAEGNNDAMQIANRTGLGTTGKYAFEQVKKIVAPGTPIEQLKFNGIIVLDTKHRLSDTFYYSLHAVTDYYGGLFKYWFNNFLNGKLPAVPTANYGGEFAAVAERRNQLTQGLGGVSWLKKRSINASIKKLDKVEARLKELSDSKRYARATEALGIVSKKAYSLLGYYEIDPGVKPTNVDIYKMNCPVVDLNESQVPTGVKGIMDKLRKTYARVVIPNRFYMQNLSTLKESLLSILAGLGVVKLFEKLIPHQLEMFVAPFGEVLANLLNGIADMLSGAVNKGPNGEGEEQAKAEHASKGALKWGLLGGFVTSVANTLTIAYFNGTTGARLLQSFWHALAGNFTTQTVSQFGAWNGLFRKTGHILQRIGLVDAKVNVDWETFKEVNINNIFRLWQTVIGSTALWTSTFVIGMLGIIEKPDRAGMFGGMLLFLTAVLETPMAAVGISLNPGMNRRKVLKELRKTVEAAESSTAEEAVSSTVKGAQIKPA